jgi:hypothetical protein
VPAPDPLDGDEAGKPVGRPFSMRSVGDRLHLALIIFAAVLLAVLVANFVTAIALMTWLEGRFNLRLL